MFISKEDTKEFFAFGRWVFGILPLLISSFLISCSSTHTVSVPIWEPAPVELANEIKGIGIINQSPGQQTAPELNGLEAWVAYSDEELSENAKNAALNALYQELAKDDRFDTILIIPQQKDTSSLVFSDSDNIPWEEMMSICKENNVDALFALSYHQTDTEISLRKTRINQKDLVRENFTIKGHELKLETLIENGWRIYDPFNRQILDEIAVNKQIVSKGEGEDPFLAFEAIEDRRDSVMYAGKTAGAKFGSRINPSAEQILRPYYAKGSVNLEKADSLAQLDKWKEAAKFWENDLNHPTSKIRGRAHFNMAVVNELHGDLETAMEWAAKSNTIYESKLTQEYWNELNHRLAVQSLIEERAIKSITATK